MKISNKCPDVVKEYAKKLSDDDLRFLGIRFVQRVGSDISEVIDILQKDLEIDKWLSGSNNANEFFDMVDQIDSAVQYEVKKRRL